MQQIGRQGAFRKSLITIILRNALLGCVSESLLIQIFRELKDRAKFPEFSKISVNICVVHYYLLVIGIVVVLVNRV